MTLAYSHLRSSTSAKGLGTAPGDNVRVHGNASTRMVWSSIRQSLLKISESRPFMVRTRGKVACASSSTRLNAG